MRSSTFDIQKIAMHFGGGGVGSDHRGVQAGQGAQVDLARAGVDDVGVIVAAATAARGFGLGAGSLDLLAAQANLDDIALAHGTGVYVIVIGAVAQDLDLPAFGQVGGSGEAAVGAPAERGAVRGDPGIAGLGLGDIPGLDVALETVREDDVRPAVARTLNS